MLLFLSTVHLFKKEEKLLVNEESGGCVNMGQYLTDLTCTDKFLIWGLNDETENIGSDSGELFISLSSFLKHAVTPINHTSL